MQTNMASISLPPSTKTLRVVDIPGHPRIRDQFREYIPDAKAVAFVVDASTVSRNGAAVAEYVSRDSNHGYITDTPIPDISTIYFTSLLHYRLRKTLRRLQL
jgi:hypothetical protein